MDIKKVSRQYKKKSVSTKRTTTTGKDLMSRCYVSLESYNQTRNGYYTIRSKRERFVTSVPPVMTGKTNCLSSIVASVVRLCTPSAVL